MGKREAAIRDRSEREKEFFPSLRHRRATNSRSKMVTKIIGDEKAARTVSFPVALIRLAANSPYLRDRRYIRRVKSRPSKFDTYER